MRMLFAVAIPLVLGAGNALGVTIKTFQFKPKEVAAHAGDRIVVANEDGIQHSLTADQARGAGPFFDTGFIGKGEEGSFAAPAPGTYAFHCERHPSMTGVLKVE